jgi:phosphoglycerate-specific signal transduction histidine kinase
MAIQYNKPWDERTTEERIDFVRKELSTFIDFFNMSVIQRNEQRNNIVDRLEKLEKAVKSIEARLDAQGESGS